MSPPSTGLGFRLCVPLALVMVPVASAFWGKKEEPTPDPPSIFRQAWDMIVVFFLEAEGWGVPGLPVQASFLDTILALDTCASYRRHMGNQKHPWLQVFFACMIGTFGGTTIAAFFLGQPPGWLGSTSSPLAFCLAFWLIFCLPGDIPYKLITRSRFVELLFGYINTLSAGHAITSWGQDGALKGSHYAPGNSSAVMSILVGTVAGCGGGVTANWLNLTGRTNDWAFGTPPVLKGPSITVKTAAFSSLAYYFLRNPHGWWHYGEDAFLPHSEAKAAIWCIWLVVLTLHEIVGIPDPTEPLTNLLGTLFFCPKEIGQQPEKGVYESIFGDSAVVDKDAALSGFGFVKAQSFIERKSEKGKQKAS